MISPRSEDKKRLADARKADRFSLTLGPPTLPRKRKRRSLRSLARLTNAPARLHHARLPRDPRGNGILPGTIIAMLVDRVT